MIEANQIKEIATSLETDLCGIAPAERFSNAPAGFRPSDIYPDVKSVVVFAKRFPEGVFFSKSYVPYTFACDTILRDVFRITCELTMRLQDLNITAVPIPSEPYEYWDEEKREGKGILSLKHAGYLAGLGVLGKNTLLMNDSLGNMITLGAVLVNIELEGDPVAQYKTCSEKCQLCIESCPAKALDGTKVEQKLCRQRSNFLTKKGYALYTCNICRSVCPKRGGT